MNLDEAARRVAPIFERDGNVLRAAVFGSFARGEETPDSDVDFCITFARGTSLFDLSHLGRVLEEALDRKVDIATPRSLHHSLKNDILSEQIIIYETAQG